MKNISILGCGWLGKPLALYLQKEGFRVKGSSSSHEKLPGLKKVGIDAYFVSCSETKVEYEDEHFFETDILIVNIPPRRATGFNYPSSMKLLSDEVAKLSIQRVIFISATSVYPDNGQLVSENDASPLTERSRTLLDAENHFLDNRAFATTVVRMSGLIGPGRVPGVTKRQVILSDGPVNLIHLDDCISIIHQIIIKKPKGRIYNASSPEQPLRSALYKHVRKLGFETLEISEEFDINRKRVSSQKLMEALDYSFKYKNPLEIEKKGYLNNE